MSLSAEVATTWYRLAEARAQREVLDEQIETNETVLELLQRTRAVRDQRGVGPEAGGQQVDAEGVARAVEEVKVGKANYDYDHIDNPEFQADMLETLDETVGKMKGLIARLKNIKETKQMNFVPCDLADIVRRGLKEAGSPEMLVAAGPVPVCIDMAEIEKVVHNLLINAYEADAQKDAVVVEVGKKNGMAFFEVTDHGCGMSEDFIRNRLFKPFQSTKWHGFGIGLYQCRHIVEAHGGKIDVLSKEGEGSTFRVQLPAADM